MRYLKPLMLAAMAIFAFAAVGTAVAQAEVAREPSILILENGVTGLAAIFKGTTSNLATLSGKELPGTGIEGNLKSCKNLKEGSEKDTTLCESLLTLTGVKKEKVSCRSESAAGTKDASETLLDVVDVHLANGENANKELVPLVLLKVLGQSGGEEELIMNCGGLKDKIKGVLPCLLLPGLVNIPTTKEAEISCKVSISHDQEEDKCELLCEWLTAHPFEANLGNGFEDAGMNLTVKGKFNKDIFIDD